MKELIFVSRRDSHWNFYLSGFDYVSEIFMEYSYMKCYVNGRLIKIKIPMKLMVVGHGKVP